MGTYVRELELSTDGRGLGEGSPRPGILGAPRGLKEETSRDPEDHAERHEREGFDAPEKEESDHRKRTYDADGDQCAVGAGLQNGLTPVCDSHAGIDNGCAQPSPPSRVSICENATAEQEFPNLGNLTRRVVVARSTRVARSGYYGDFRKIRPARFSNR